MNILLSSILEKLFSRKKYLGIYINSKIFLNTA